MYSASDVAVDKGLGIDFSDITNLVKSALPAGLNIYQQQMQLKQIKAMGQSSVYGGYNVPVVGLPAAQMYGMQPQPNIPRPYYPGSGGINMTAIMLGVGGLAVLVGAYMVLK